MHRSIGKQSTSVVRGTRYRYFCGMWFCLFCDKETTFPVSERPFTYYIQVNHDDPIFSFAFGSLKDLHQGLWSQICVEFCTFLNVLLHKVVKTRTASEYLSHF